MLSEMAELRSPCESKRIDSAGLTQYRQGREVLEPVGGGFLF